MPRRRAVPPLGLVLTLVLGLTACGGGGGHGGPGAAGVGDPYFPRSGNGGYDVTHYGLTLAWEPRGNRLTGTAEITARAGQDLDAFHLDLLGMDVTDVTVQGRRARWSRSGQELTVRPRDGLPEGRTFRTAVRYAGSPRTITDPDGSEEGWLPTADGALGLGEPTGSMAWFPGDHHPADKAAYDVRITVPEGLTAVSNGELTSTTTANGRTTYVWHTAEPMASYVATLAIGRYTVTRSATRRGLPVYTAVDPTEAKDAGKVLAGLPGIVDWEEDTFGPYPFSSTGAIVDRPGDAGYALETQNRPVFPGAPDTGTLVHELAHQWFGDSVTPKSWRDMWLNEGFATYAEWLWQEEHGGDTADEIFRALYRGDYREPADNAQVWAFPPADPPDAAHISDPPVYYRGAMVLHTIRELVGDAAFRRIVRGWAARYRHRNADTADFTAYVEKAAPDRDFGPVWDDWLHGAGRPRRP